MVESGGDGEGLMDPLPSDVGSLLIFIMILGGAAVVVYGICRGIEWIFKQGRKHSRKMRGIEEPPKRPED